MGELVVELFLQLRELRVAEGREVDWWRMMGQSCIGTRVCEGRGLLVLSPALLGVAIVQCFIQAENLSSRVDCFPTFWIVEDENSISRAAHLWH